MKSISIFIILSVSVCVKACYWNRQCPYTLYSTKTPYDTIRGDIRDHTVPENCQAVNIWTINRHGNRNPGSGVTGRIKVIAALKDEIVASYDAGRSQLCAQDIEEFRKWSWNDTLDSSASFLTGFGYEELYDIGKRLREKYPHLLQGSVEDFYFRPTNEQRTITSSIAFIHGLTDGTNMSLAADEFRVRDDVIRPYANCDRYQQEVKEAQILEDQMAAYASTPEYVAVQNAVQQRLGITTQISADDIYSFYEICRFYRSWTPTLQSPWCSVFTDQDLVVLEYRDDVRHYYRNGYGSWVNVNLGGTAMRDLYENFQASVQGQGKKIMAYFTHDTMMEMVYCALGIFKDDSPLQATGRDPNRLWKTSNIGAMGVNIIAVLNSCVTSGTQSYRVQIFINEKESTVCPPEGCTWEQFQDKFQGFAAANLDFCSLDYREPESVPEGNSASAAKGIWMMVALAILLVAFRW